MIGIKNIGCYIPEYTESNYSLMDKFGVDDNFLRNKLGVEYRAIKDDNEKSSGLCLKAFQDLLNREKIVPDEIGCCVVVTQNPDQNIPHVSAIVHGAIGLAENCATFDISLGCSGYVYALSIVKAFMHDNNIEKALLFTSDPYSEIIDPDDKNTAMIFGDAATVTLLVSGGALLPVAFDFGTKGKDFDNIMIKDNFYMNGRAVFNFTAATIPLSIRKLLDKTGLVKEDIKKWYFHQGSKYIVDTIATRLGLDVDRVLFGMYKYGNTVSSSIPILLKQDIGDLRSGEKIVLCGFGVGLSWASAVFEMR